LCNFVNVYTKLVNVYTNMADNNKMLMILTWFSVTITITSQLVMAADVCNVNFVNVYMIAYRVHVYMRASLIHSPNRNPDSSNRISPQLAHRFFWTGFVPISQQIVSRH